VRISSLGGKGLPRLAQREPYGDWGGCVDPARELIFTRYG
jgi:hypothetical protein